MKINYAQKFYDFVSAERPNYEVLGTYINNSTKILIRHKTCGYEWEVRPNYFKDRLGSCPKCLGKLKFTTEQFKDWISNNRTEYSLLGEYINSDTKVLMEHTICSHKWLVSPHDFKSKLSSCPKCSNARQYSNISIKWLQELSTKFSINIQHAENGGEYRLPNLGYKVDGYSVDTNTVFEFHGTAYHGGYDYRRDNLISAISSKTPEELFEATIQKMNKISSSGYKVFCVFESDYSLGNIGDYY